MWSLLVLERTRDGHRQSNGEHRNCFKGDVGETSERQDGAHMGFTERIDNILDRTELLVLKGYIVRYIVNCAHMND